MKNEQTLEQLLESKDADNKPYFTKEQKTKLLKEHLFENNLLPSFSTKSFSNKDKKQQDYERLMAMIKDLNNRADIERHMIAYPRIEDKIIYLTKLHASDIREGMDDEICENILDLNSAKTEELNESFLRTFGFLIQKVMERMFGQSDTQITIRGSQSQINAFADTISGEKRYMDAFEKHGLDSPQTYRVKAVRDGAIGKFERATGLKWPFKDKK